MRDGGALNSAEVWLHMQKEAGILNGEKAVQTTTRQLREGTMEVCSLSCICDPNMRGSAFWSDAKRQLLLLLLRALLFDTRLRSSCRLSGPNSDMGVRSGNRCSVCVPGAGEEGRAARQLYRPAYARQGQDDRQGLH